ncbi:hypothetical protein XENOCAPTIV_011588 [Xenoophorus captivus]|uniref:Uncharacterized protein n=1 Tax=Xenoophorus captivus TaxID=1517983 RepID=A0ABV0S7H8_9TELE
MAERWKFYGVLITTLLVVMLLPGEYTARDYMYHQCAVIVLKDNYKCGSMSPKLPGIKHLMNLALIVKHNLNVSLQLRVCTMTANSGNSLRRDQRFVLTVYFVRYPIQNPKVRVKIYSTHQFPSALDNFLSIREEYESTKPVHAAR